MDTKEGGKSAAFSSFFYMTFYDWIALFPRNCFGLMPVYFLNKTEKYAGSWIPTAMEISEVRMSVCKSVFAFSIL